VLDNDRGILASNGRFHELLIEKLAAARAEASKHAH
jgi:hypothetical protein